MFLSPNNAPPMRQSCDRCHKQKLRCTREGSSNTGACDRCARKRTSCVYSSSLPKGRPSIYLPKDETPNSRSRSESALISPISPPSLNRQDTGGPQPEPSTPAPASAASASAEIDHDVEETESTVVDAGTLNAGHGTKLSEDTQGNDNMDLMLDIDDPSINMPAGSWPWSHTFAGEDSTCTDWDDHNLRLSTLDWDTFLDTHQDSSLISLKDRPNVLRGAGSTKNTASGGGLPSPPTTETISFLHRRGHCHGCITPDNEINANVQSTLESVEPLTIDTKDSDVIITQLSQLSMRLAPLASLRHTLAKVVQSPTSKYDIQHCENQVLDDAAFESVVAWLANPSPGPDAKTRCGMLHQTFSASHYLLEILQGPSTEASTENTFCPVQLAGASMQVLHSSQRSNSKIIRHMVMSCHILLLNIYTSLLMALEHDALQRSAHKEIAALGQIRLVSVVQLCSYIIERQNQAVDEYSFPDKKPLFGASPQNTNRTDDEEVIGEIKKEVQQRLASLQQALRI